MRLLVLGLLLLLPTLHDIDVAVSASESECDTLLSLLSHWTSVPPSVKSTWKKRNNASLSDSNPCSWAGVQCHQLHVVSLNLTAYGIVGNIAPHIGNLTMLRHLDLTQNYLTGQIPHTLTNLHNLIYLSLSTNLLTGHIPHSLITLPNLRYLDLSDNTLEGPIPTSICIWNISTHTHLSMLYLQDNHLSGPVPSSIGNCTNLQELFLNGNQLQGVLPHTLNNLNQLTYLGVANNTLSGPIPLAASSGSCNNKKMVFLDLSYNGFSGGIPSGLGNCSALSEFAAVKSNLVGSIPSSLALLTRLTVLRLPENHLSGTIPPELGNCKSLTQLHLYSNQLEGKIPNELGKLSNLKDLELFNNQLTGEIPLNIWRIQGLEHLLVYNNSLSGELPLEMTELKHLENISLFNNHFSGAIPQNLGINSSLVQLDFTNNKFSGTVPPNICFGKKLVVLNMGINQLQGSIPPGVGSCTSLRRTILKQNDFTGPLPVFESNPHLTYIDFSNNKINGPIPPSLGSCTNLTALILSVNKFTGLIPPELGNLVNLWTLDLAHNNLEGPLPSQLSNCNKMDRFDVGFNFLNGSLPSSLRRSWTKLRILILRENRFSGGIPAFLSEFKMLSELQLGGNMLGGRIPESVGALQNLIYGLNLSSNGLIGGIPVEIGNLKILQVLDLSQNNLTGSIEVLDELPSLVEINISYNSFHGPVPKMLMKLLNSLSSSFLGNPGLCITCSMPDGLVCKESSIYLKPCDTDNKSTDQKGLSKADIVVIALGSSVVVVVLGLVYYYVLVVGRKPNYNPEVNNLSAGEGGSVSLLNKVMEATANLNDRYIVGRGAHGVVYKAVIGPDDKAFAIKKLGFAVSKGKNNLNMVREIKTLGRIRHRNLVKLEDFWLRKDYGLILYNYMPNGSLHDVLHEKVPSPSLEWAVRYNIAVGIAHGLAYLHHDCDPPIVHRDIKPKNILLDSDMEPHIADFGIAKLLDQSGTCSNPNDSISLPGTIGYIAPENAYRTANSRESDVYSYGVVLIELLTRKKAADPSFADGSDVVSWVRSMWMGKADHDHGGEIIDQIVDSRLAEEFLDSHIREQVTNVLMVALRCTEQDPHKRPPMTLVTRQLVSHQMHACMLPTTTPSK